ncbi:MULTISPECIES: hypothetical protein [unclassified Rhodococcus (in: high G+C Gram-positive bacteria)]|nr:MULTISPECIES: hypothetical protein [unclassified Rhodococcus (in: high G+C Gram-positive bacteria)]
MAGTAGRRNAGPLVDAGGGATEAGGPGCGSAEVRKTAEFDSVRTPLLAG